MAAESIMPHRLKSTMTRPLRSCAEERLKKMGAVGAGIGPGQVSFGGRVYEPVRLDGDDVQFIVRHVLTPVPAGRGPGCPFAARRKQDGSRCPKYPELAVSANASPLRPEIPEMPAESFSPLVSATTLDVKFIL